MSSTEDSVSKNQGECCEECGGLTGCFCDVYLSPPSYSFDSDDNSECDTEDREVKVDKDTRIFAHFSCGVKSPATKVFAGEIKINGYPPVPNDNCSAVNARLFCTDEGEYEDVLPTEFLGEIIFTSRGDKVPEKTILTSPDDKVPEKTILASPDDGFHSVYAGDVNCKPDKYWCLLSSKNDHEDGIIRNNSVWESGFPIRNKTDLYGDVILVQSDGFQYYAFHPSDCGVSSWRRSPLQPSSSIG